MLRDQVNNLSQARRAARPLLTSQKTNLGCFKPFLAAGTQNNISFFVCADILYHSFDKILGKLEKNTPHWCVFFCLQ